MIGKYLDSLTQRQIPPARYLDICIGYYYISRWYISYMYSDGIGIILCNIVSVSMILFCFLCWSVWEFIPGTLICGVMLSGLWCILLGLVAVR